MALRDKARAAQKRLAERRTRKKAKKLKRERTVNRAKEKAKSAAEPFRDLGREVAEQPEVQAFTGVARRVARGPDRDSDGGGGSGVDLQDVLVGSSGGDSGSQDGSGSFEVVDDLNDHDMGGSESFEVIGEFDDL